MESWRTRVVRTDVRLSASPPSCGLKEEIPAKYPTHCSNKTCLTFSVAFFLINFNIISGRVGYFPFCRCVIRLCESFSPQARQRPRKFPRWELLVLCKACPPDRRFSCMYHPINSLPKHPSLAAWCREDDR